MTGLKGKTVLVGISGGIAAYKTCSLVSMLVKAGATVHVCMTKNATQFVTPLTLETLSHNRVVIDTFDRNFTFEVEHISLAKKADICVIAPATANVIAKFACGIADDFLTTTVLACKCPVVFAPAMNTAMLENPVTQDNINKLVARGWIKIDGDDGYLACGDTGRGRMAEPKRLFDAVDSVFNGKNDLSGKTVLITSGATRMPIDPVRYLTNRSSGKMGYSLACAAYARGANIIYIKGYTDKFDVPWEWTTIQVETTEDMLQAVKAHYEKSDIAVMAAAPCDYSVSYRDTKIKSDELTLELKKASDCAEWLGKHKGKRKLVVFAAETDHAEENANKKLLKKNADLVVLNDVTKPGAGFEVDTNIATLISANSAEKLDIMSKRELADIIFDRVLSL